MRKCARLQCEAILSPGRPSQQLYCGRRCQRMVQREKTAAAYYEEKLAVRNGTFLRQHAELLSTAQYLLLKQAPEQAIGYIAGLLVEEDVFSHLLGGTPIKYLLDRIWFPEKRENAQFRMRLDGSRSRLPYFALRPVFEPPRVPFTTAYMILYILPGGIVCRETEQSVRVYLPGVPMCFGKRKNIQRTKRIE